MESQEEEYDIVIIGAGLSGLTCAYYLKKMVPDIDILVLERSATAGGLTGNWIDHRFAPDKKFQQPMHMIFIEKYVNLYQLIQEVGGCLSPRYTGYDIITSNGIRHRLEMNDWAARKLPPPLHGIGMFTRLRLPWLDKWDLFKLACVSSYCARAILNSEGKEQQPKLVPNTLSLESLELLLGIRPGTRDFIEAITPSIYNLHPWYTSAPRMASVIAGTMMMSRNSLHYHVFGKNYNAAFIDNYVETLRSMGVQFRFCTEVRRLESSADGSRVDTIWYRTQSSQTEGATRYICANCGAENYCADRAFCSRCGLDTTLDKVYAGTIKQPVGTNLWQEPGPRGYHQVRCRRLITAMYPHMIAALIPIDSPLRRHPYVRACFSSRGNQTQLSIGRVYYRQPVTRDQKYITGTHNPYFCFNGCQSVYNNFGGADLAYEGDVVDVLLDVGIIRDAHSHEVQIQRIVSDLQRVYPDADPHLVDHVSFANIYPDVLYLSEQPAIAGLHRIFNTHRTGAANWYVAGCHSGLIGIGMESAVESAMSTVNAILDDMESSQRVAIKPYSIHLGARMAASLGKALLLWNGGRKYQRLAANNYSMPKMP